MPSAWQEGSRYHVFKVFGMTRPGIEPATYRSALFFVLKCKQWSANCSSSTYLGRVLLGLFRLFLFRNRSNRIHRISVPNKTDRALFREQNSWRDQKRPARTRNFPAKILFRPFCYGEQNERKSIPSFRNRNSSQKNTSTVYSGIGINGIDPKARALKLT